MEVDKTLEVSSATRYSIYSYFYSELYLRQTTSGLKVLNRKEKVFLGFKRIL